MIAVSLQSGSSGNCYFVQSGSTRLIVEAGIPYSRAMERLAALGYDAAGVQGILISHDHTDHVSCAGTFHRKLGSPLYMSVKTAAAVNSKLGKLGDRGLVTFRPGQTIHFDGVRVETLRTPHDAVDPCGFVIDDGQTRVGILTDLGHASRAVKEAMATLDGVFIESNFDRRMLRQNSTYPEALKDRIWGGRGHLENKESATLVFRHTTERIRYVVLSHLSQDNNTPELALRAHHDVWDSEFELRPRPAIYVAPRDGVSPPLEF